MHLYSAHLVLAQDPKAGNDATHCWTGSSNHETSKWPCLQVNLTYIILNETPFTDVLLGFYYALVQAVGI